MINLSATSTTPEPLRAANGHVPFQPHVEGLRGLAVLAVVFYHAEILGMTAGYVGVDVFFVISGFLISWNIFADVSRRKFSFLVFYEKRARRIFPALIVMIAVLAATAWYVLMPSDYRRLLQSAGATALFSSNIFFWLQPDGYFAAASAEEPLLHTWSLGIEEQFYILFPILIWALRRLAPRRLFWAIAICALASFALACIGAFVRPSATFYLLPTRAWELLAGSLLALWKPPQLARAHLATLLSLIAAALLLGPIWLYPRHIPFPGLAALPPVLGAALVIGLGPSGLTSRALSWRPLRFVGRVSYSFYLWHFPLLALAAYVSLGQRGPFLDLFAAGLAFLIATASTLFLEEPLRRRSPRVRSATVVIGGGAALLISSCLCFALATTSGLRGVYGSSMQLSPLPVRNDWCLSATGSEPGDPHCRIGAPGDPRFLLWGDSHSLAAQGIFDASARQTGVAGLLVGAFGCPPYASHAETANGKCESITQRLLQTLAANRSIRTVILLAHWPQYLDAPRVGGFRSPDQLDAGPSGQGQGYEIAALNGAIRRFEALGWSVVLVGPIPEAEGSVPRMMYLRSRGLISGRVEASSEALTRMEQARAALVTAARGTGARVFDAAPLLCHGQTCPLESNGVALLNDDNHLSAAGAELLRPLVDQILRSIPNTQPPDGRSRP